MPENRDELLSYPELEAQLAQSPDDAATWLVYEDWLLEQRDPRAAVIEAERAGDIGAAAHARGAIKTLVLGPRAATFEGAIAEATWRAGFIRACTFDATGERGAHRLAELLASPAARLLTELDVELDRLAARAELRELGAARVLRRLGVRAREPDPAGLLAHEPGDLFDATQLEPLDQLVDLYVHALSELNPSPGLARLHALSLVFSRDLVLDRLAAAPLHGVIRLSLTVEYGTVHPASTDLAAVWPALRDLRLSVDEFEAESVLRLVIASGLVAQLRSFSLDTGKMPRELTPEQRATFLGGAFASVEHVRLTGRFKVD